MIEIIVNKDYQNVQVVSDSLEKLDKLLTYMKRKIYESIGHCASVLDLYEWVGVSFLDTNAEMMNRVWTSLEKAKINRDRNIDRYVLSMPPARKQNMIHLNPFKEMHINVPRGCGKTMTAMKMIEDICENNKLREEINSKIKKYSDMDSYGYRFVLEYRHQPCEKRYRVEYRVPFDSPCFLEFWPDEEVDKYLDEQENKARKELIDRVINDIIKEEKIMPLSNGMNEFVITVPRGYAPCTIGSGSYTIVPVIEKIEIYNERVVKVTFKDGTFTKSICAENDIFDVDTGITICLLKKMLGKNGHKIYNNIIRNAHKLLNDQENKKIEKQMAKEEARKKQKAVEMKKKAKKLKEKEEQIDIQKQAFVRAMQETGMVEGGR